MPEKIETPPVVGKKGKSAKPAVPPAPPVPTLTREEQIKKVLAELRAIGAPVAPDGSSIPTWRQDNASIDHVDLSTDGQEWHTFLKSKDVAIECAKIPSEQEDALWYVVNSYTAKVASEKAGAYSKLVSTHADLLNRVFGKYTVRVYFKESNVPCLQFLFKDAVSIAKIRWNSIMEGLKVMSLRRRALGPRSPKETDGQYDTVLGMMDL